MIGIRRAAETPPYTDQQLTEDVHGDDGVVGLGDGADSPRQELGAPPGVVRHADEYPGAGEQVSVSVAALLDGVHALN